jgi:MFS family permease
MGVFRNRQFSSGILTVMMMALGQAGILFSVPIFFQAVRGLNAFHTGLAIMPASITALVIAPLAGVLVKKISPKLLIQVGILAIAGGMLMMFTKLNINATSHDFLPAMIVYGLGIGLMMAQINNVIMSSVTVEKAGEVSGISNTMRQLGMTLGSAIIGAVLLTAVSTNLTNNINDSLILPEAVKPQILNQVSVNSANIEFYGASNLPAMPEKIQNEIVRIINQSTTDANRKSILFATGFLLLTFLMSFALPGKKEIMASMNRPVSSSK